MAVPYSPLLMPDSPSHAHNASRAASWVLPCAVRAKLATLPKSPIGDAGLAAGDGKDASGTAESSRAWRKASGFRSFSPHPCIVPPATDSPVCRGQTSAVEANPHTALLRPPLSVARHQPLPDYRLCDVDAAYVANTNFQTGKDYRNKLASMSARMTFVVPDDQRIPHVKQLLNGKCSEELRAQSVGAMTQHFTMLLSTSCSPDGVPVKDADGSAKPTGHDVYRWVADTLSLCWSFNRPLCRDLAHAYLRALQEAITHDTTPDHQHGIAAALSFMLNNTYILDPADGSVSPETSALFRSALPYVPAILSHVSGDFRGGNIVGRLLMRVRGTGDVPLMRQYLAAAEAALQPPYAAFIDGPGSFRETCDFYRANDIPEEERAQQAAQAKLAPAPEETPFHLVEEVLGHVNIDADRYLASLKWVSGAENSKSREAASKASDEIRDQLVKQLRWLCGHNFPSAIYSLILTVRRAQREEGVQHGTSIAIADAFITSILRSMNKDKEGRRVLIDAIKTWCEPFEKTSHVDGESCKPDRLALLSALMRILPDLTAHITLLAPTDVDEIREVQKACYRVIAPILVDLVDMPGSYLYRQWAHLEAVFKILNDLQDAQLFENFLTALNSLAASDHRGVTQPYEVKRLIAQKKSVLAYMKTRQERMAAEERKRAGAPAAVGAAHEPQPITA